tara:strand:+ start:174 stop:479 length:306 start_codon:yes stop_codon:yes gene_type:complete
MNVEFNDKIDIESETLSEVVSSEDGELKEWLVNYVGTKSEPEKGEVTVQHIVDVMASEFPEFLLAVAEENWVRGYQQGLVDVDNGKKLVEEYKNQVNPDQD